MFLQKCLIIAYSSPGYSLTSDFLKSLKDIGVSSSNINLYIDYSLKEEEKKTINKDAFTNFWKICIINKVKNLIKVLKENINNNEYKYFISSDCDIIYLRKNLNKWFNLENYINSTNNDIYFMREDISHFINAGFYIIKNNENLLDTISFFINIYTQLTSISICNVNNLVDQDLINKQLHLVNFNYIPNEYVIWGIKIYDISNSLIHHAVCETNCSSKKIQINHINNILNS
jgi:hypothetical protein